MSVETEVHTEEHEPLIQRHPNVPQELLNHDIAHSEAYKYASIASKILMTFGTAPSLWNFRKEFEEDTKVERTRQMMTDLFSLPNIAIAAHYWNIGLALGFLSTPITYYLVYTLDASSAQTNTFNALAYLPWCLKVFFGLMSDSVPIQEQHRKPYYFLGWLLFILANVWLACYSEPSLWQICGLYFISVNGYMLADVVTDALVVERSAFETPEELGMMRTEAYVIRAAGGIVGAVLGGVLYNKDTWGWGLSIAECCMLQALIPVATLVPVFFWLYDPGTGYRDFSVQLEEIWELVQRRTVWYPMGFVYVYSLLQISNPVWYNYLVLGLDFSDWDLGVITIVAAVFTWLSLYVYQHFFFGTSWRLIYYATTLLNAFLSILQLLLIFSLTFGIPDIWFATGDYAFISFVLYIQFMPMCILAVSVIPDGVEGTSYALLTTWMNVASEVGYDIGTLMTNIWNVSNCALEEGKTNGLWKLTVFTTVLQLSPIVLIWMFPDGKEEVREMIRTEYSSRVAGIIFLTVLAASIICSLFYGVYIVFEPTDDDDYDDSEC